VRVVSNKLSSRALRALLAVLLCFGLVSELAAQSGTRSFPMTLWVGGNHDSDIPVIWEGDPQPAGRSIVILADWAVDGPLAAMGYDWSRIAAVEIDEPYNSVGYNTPYTCNWDGSTWDQVNQIYQALAAKAAELKSLSASTRFWVNFTDRQVLWMIGTGAESDGDGSCPVGLNGPYIDIISIDLYYMPFVPGVKFYYDWFSANPAKPDQQLALIPGTFFRIGVDKQATQASYLQGYFDYANTMNQNCDLALGTRGGTGYFDGCRVWMVMGWLAGNHTEGNTDYRGEEDPTSASITGIWRAEQLVPLRADLARPLQLERGKMVQAFLPLLLNN
jgi:hypothetical protein